MMSEMAYGAIKPVRYMGVDYGMNVFEDNDVSASMAYAMQAMRYNGNFSTYTVAPPNEYEVYSDPARMGYRTRNQDREIAELRSELKTKLDDFNKKEKSDQKDLKDLIAYYYNK